MSVGENNFSVIGLLFSSHYSIPPPVRLSRTLPLVPQKILFMKATDYSNNKPAHGTKLHLGRIIHFSIIKTNYFDKHFRPPLQLSMSLYVWNNQDEFFCITQMKPQSAQFITVSPRSSKNQ